MNEYEKVRLKRLKEILDKEKIQYKEDKERLLISLEKLYTVVGIIHIHDINVIDEVIHYEEDGGNGEHYYLISKSKNTPIIEDTNIKKRRYTNVFDNTIYIDLPYEVMDAEDGSGYVTDSYIKQCLPPNIEYNDSVDCIYNYIEIKLVNAIIV